MFPPSLNPLVIHKSILRSAGTSAIAVISAIIIVVTVVTIYVAAATIAPAVVATDDPFC